MEEFWLVWYQEGKAPLESIGKGRRVQLIGVSCINFEHLHGILDLPLAVEPSKELEWPLEYKYDRRRVLLSLWCIQVGQANGAWRLNSFLCSNVALFPA
jgi:hypothetical protein